VKKWLAIWGVAILVLSAVAFGVGYAYGDSGGSHLEKGAGIKVSAISVYAYKNSKEVKVLVDISPKEKPDSGGYWIFVREIEGTEGWKPGAEWIGFGYEMKREYKYTPDVWCKIKSDMEESVFKVLYINLGTKNYDEEVLRLKNWIDKPIVKVSTSKEAGVSDDIKTYEGITIDELCREGLPDEQ